MLWEVRQRACSEESCELKLHHLAYVCGCGGCFVLVCFGVPPAASSACACASTPARPPVPLPLRPPVRMLTAQACKQPPLHCPLPLLHLPPRHRVDCGVACCGVYAPRNSATAATFCSQSPLPPQPSHRLLISPCSQKPLLVQPMHWRSTPCIPSAVLADPAQQTPPDA
jgi:hypothetical protein